MRIYSTTVPADEASIVTITEIIEIDPDAVTIEVVHNGSGRAVGLMYTVSDEIAAEIEASREDAWTEED